MAQSGHSGLEGQLAVSWPAVDTQTVAWATNPDQRNAAGRRPSQKDRMLTEITVEIPHHIAAAPLPLSQEAARASEEAAHSIALLDGRAVSLSGLSDLLVRSETVASSKVEHIYADVTDIARASIGADAGEQARRTVAAATAMQSLVHEGVTNDSILAAHAELMDGDLLEGDWAGRYRQQQNWIGGSDFSPADAIHIPPPAALVQGLMDDLVAFAGRADISAIAQSALAHAQFEAIHPFTDGNGRVGRAIIGSILRTRGITRSATVPIAAVMLANVDTYFERLTAYRDGDAQGMIVYLSESATTASDAAMVSADRLAALPVEWADKVKPRKGSSAGKLLDALLQTPILDAEKAARITGAVPNRTYDALAQLVGAGVLTELTGHTRNRVWLAQDVMDELSELEDRIGRRAVPSSRWR